MVSQFRYFQIGKFKAKKKRKKILGEKVIFRFYYYEGLRVQGW